MENKNQKFQELIKKMETLQENEKGQLKGGFMSLSLSSSTLPVNPVKNSNTNNSMFCSCSCTNN